MGHPTLFHKILFYYPTKTKISLKICIYPKYNLPKLFAICVSKFRKVQPRSFPFANFLTVSFLTFLRFTVQDGIRCLDNEWKFWAKMETENVMEWFKDAKIQGLNEKEWIWMCWHERNCNWWFKDEKIQGIMEREWIWMY